MNQCDPCLKICDCVETARDWDGEFYALCCKCARTHPYFWRFSGKRRLRYDECEHNARPDGRSVFLCRHDSRHVTSYSIITPVDTRSGARQRNRTTLRPRLVPSHFLSVGARTVETSTTITAGDRQLT
ncbi:uncharacterized protein LOC124372540 isoform X1 [Homalodisca vitripennis]|uniref:uncharacterized protein LOC124372540 isoform X1 n=1 Tax=Homalodisca vitripennis TaxID=197043 RepID=UPI001EEA4AE1|nr:uncharacterized protein LOC124372540 isoform X1 [Homalodisca vitripennis]